MQCIVFSMGRVLCSDNAKKLAKEKVNLLPPEEAAYVRKFYERCISDLRAEDRSLPQVQALLPLLCQGIGVHHAGLLPLLKEVVEMLFSTGYIKVLFATETFAIGVNMPAKSVCFSGLAKNDGLATRYFLSSE